MEKAFLITKESDYYKKLTEYINMENEQKAAITEFFKSNGIESQKYCLRGDGSINQRYSKSDIDNITLRIIPTKNDDIIFSKQLSKADKYGLRKFKKNSKIGKAIVDFCKDKDIVINIFPPQLSDYIPSLYKYSINRFPCEQGCYLKIYSEYNIDENNISNGFIPIKMSEYYMEYEKYTNNK